MTQPAVSGNLNQLAQHLTAASGGDFMANAAQLVRVAAEEVQQEAVKRAPYKTGALAHSISVVFTGPMTAVIGPGKPYGVFQEFGTGTRSEFGGQPYVILPKRGRYLVFMVDGKTVFAKKVTHPGIPPHPFMRPGAAAAMEKLQRHLGMMGVSMVISGKQS